MTLTELEITNIDAAIAEANAEKDATGKDRIVLRVDDGVTPWYYTDHAEAAVFQDETIVYRTEDGVKIDQPTTTNTVAVTPAKPDPKPFTDGNGNPVRIGTFVNYYVRRGSTETLHAAKILDKSPGKIHVVAVQLKGDGTPYSKKPYRTTLTSPMMVCVSAHDLTDDTFFALTYGTD